MDGLELVDVELLVDKPNLEVDVIRRRQIDSDFLHIQPEKKFLNLDAVQISDGAILELSSNGLVIINQVIEMDVTGFGQMNDELTIGGERVVDDGVR